MELTSGLCREGFGFGTVMSDSYGSFVTLSAPKLRGTSQGHGGAFGSACGADGCLTQLFQITWPNSDASWTMSHRSTTANVMPTLTSTDSAASTMTDASGELNIIKSLSTSSTSDTPCTVTWTRPYVKRSTNPSIEADWPSPAGWLRDPST